MRICGSRAVVATRLRIRRVGATTRLVASFPTRLGMEARLDWMRGLALVVLGSPELMWRGSLRSLEGVVVRDVA